MYLDILLTVSAYLPTLSPIREPADKPPALKPPAESPAPLLPKCFLSTFRSPV